MAEAPLPHNEAQRLRSLQALRILDTPPEERFDRVTRLARKLFDVPIAMLSLVDADRQWFKSRAGIDLRETSRALSFCSHAILESGLMVVPDATLDDRFRDNPMVLNEPEIRFYAARPVKAPDGSLIGTLCIVDHKPRELPEGEGALLGDLADMLEEELKSIELATVDDLTGLTNRRGFQSIAYHTLALCQRVERPATLLLFDLDKFKEVNDTYGHAEGDRVLREFSEALLASFRESDVVARIGGDEFCVLLSGSDDAQALRPVALLERRLERVDAKRAIEFSVGVAGFDPKRHQTVGDLLKEADELMYSHKRRHG